MDDPDDPNVQLRHRLIAWAPVSIQILILVAIDGQLFESAFNFFGGLLGAAATMVFVFLPKEVFQDYRKPDEEPDRFMVRGGSYMVVFFGYVCSALLFIAILRKVFFSA